MADILPIQNLLENLIWTILHEEPNRRRIRQSTMGLLMVQLANHMDRLQGADSAQHRFSAAVLRYVEEHYRDASLSALASDMGQEAGTLSKQITRHFGCTFKALLQEKRLQRAAALLRQRCAGKPVLLATHDESAIRALGWPVVELEKLGRS